MAGQSNQGGVVAWRGDCHSVPKYLPICTASYQRSDTSAGTLIFSTNPDSYIRYASILTDETRKRLGYRFYVASYSASMARHSRRKIPRFVD